MPTIVNRVTRLLRRSVSQAEYTLAEWIENPDLSAVEGFPEKYWVITGDIVSLMDQAARDAVDAAQDAASKDSIADKLNRPTTFERAFAEILLDEFNTLRALHGLAPRTRAQLRNALRGKL